MKILFGNSGKLKNWFSITLVMLAVVAVTPSSQAQESLTLSKCWELSLENASLNPPASDNEIVFYSDTSGSIIAVNSATGTIRWRSDLSGNSLTLLKSTSSGLFVTSSFDTGDETGVSTSGVNTDTGVPSFRLALGTDLPVATVFSKAHEVFVLANAAGRVIALTPTGKRLWELDVRDKIVSNLAIGEDSLYFGTANNTIFEIDVLKGKLVRQLNSGGRTVALYHTQEVLFFGTADGRMRAIKSVNGDEIWSNYAGGGIVELIKVNGTLLISSKDNFVYAVNPKTGRKTWKRKLAGRVLGSAILKDQIGIFTTTGSKTVIALDLESGRITGKYDLESDFAGGPVKTKATEFVVPTYSGLSAFSIAKCEK